MTDLTEQYKKGELPYADENHTWLAYYLKQESGRIHADSYWRGKWGHADRNSIIKVLAPVPSYEEWQENQKSLKVLAEAYCKEKEENQQLKELLKECKPYFNALVEKRLKLEYIPQVYELLTEIDNAIGEKK